jgi:hypothetical protein
MLCDGLSAALSAPLRDGSKQSFCAWEVLVLFGALVFFAIDEKVIEYP